MKPLSRLFRLALLASTLAGALHAADPFEGRIHMTVTDGKAHSQPIDYAMKDGKMRYEFPSDSSNRGSGGVIIDFTRQQMIILIEHDGQKNFMLRPMGQPGGSPATSHGGDHAAVTAAAPVATGRTEMIAGYPATEYKVTGSKGEVTELWLAKGLGNFMFPSAQSPMSRGKPANVAPEWEALARDGGFFPLRAITRDAGGKEKSHLEVTKIDRTPLPDSLFSTDGYSEFKIPGFGGGLPSGMNPFSH